VSKRLLIIFLVGSGIIVASILAIKFSLPSVHVPAVTPNGEVSSTVPSASPSSSAASASHAPCLGDDEYADYPLNPIYPSWSKIAKVPVVISIRNKTTGMEKYKFTINDVPPANSYQLELHQCSVYMLREFQKPEWSRELWRYNYNGDGAILLLLDRDNNSPKFSSNFHVDSQEQYVALDYGDLGSSDQATIVKSLVLPDLPDILTIKGQDILKVMPSLSPNRSAEPVGWSSDGKYLWGESSEIDQSRGAYFRINIQNKTSLEAFAMPPDAVHFGPPMLDTGYILYVYGPPFTGIPEVTQQISDEWKKAGKKESLFLYNLFTKQKILVASSDNPYWNFSEHWISDSQFQYALPSGSTTTYTISQ